VLRFGVPPEPEVECPGAASEWPGLVEFVAVWPGAVLECPGLVEFVEACPGAASECPGLVELVVEWPGAAPECPGLVELVVEWPGAAPECPGLVEIGLDEPVACPGAVMPDDDPARVAAELGIRPAAGLDTSLSPAAEDFVSREAGPAPRFRVGCAGDTGSTGARR
jgi:hypothetical protein